jgi:hypothetical protein
MPMTGAQGQLSRSRLPPARLLAGMRQQWCCRSESCYRAINPSHSPNRHSRRNTARRPQIRTFAASRRPGNGGSLSCARRHTGDNNRNRELSEFSSSRVIGERASPGDVISKIDIWGEPVLVLQHVFVAPVVCAGLAREAQTGSGRPGAKALLRSD